MTDYYLERRITRDLSPVEEINPFFYGMYLPEELSAVFKGISMWVSQSVLLNYRRRIHVLVNNVITNVFTMCFIVNRESIVSLWMMKRPSLCLGLTIRLSKFGIWSKSFCEKSIGWVSFDVLMIWNCLLRSPGFKPIQILTEGSDSVTSVQLSSHEILIGYLIKILKHLLVIILVS